MFSLVSDTAEGLDRTENEIEQYQDLNDPANCFESDNSDRSTEEGSSRISIAGKRKKRTHETIRKKQLEEWNTIQPNLVQYYTSSIAMPYGQLYVWNVLIVPSFVAQTALL